MFERENPKPASSKIQDGGAAAPVRGHNLTTSPAVISERLFEGWQLALEARDNQSHIMGAVADETKKVEKRGAHLKKTDAEKVPKKEYVPTGKPRGRPKGKKVEKRGQALKKYWAEKKGEKAAE